MIALLSCRFAIFRRIVDSQEPSLNIAGVLGVFTGDLSFVLGEI